MRKIISLLIVLIFFNSCQLIINPIKDLFNGIKNKQTEKIQDKQERNPNEAIVIKSYYEKSGALKSEITVKNNKKNGPAKKYYPTGEIHTLVNYVDNIKEGETFWYYKNGQAYRVTPYKNGKMHGTRKVYYENGKLQAEIPYSNGKLVEGTKEYEQSGKLITKQPKIVFETENRLKFEDKFILKMKLSKKSSKLEFFEEKTSISGNKVQIAVKTNQSGTGKIEYIIPKGNSKMTVVMIFAKYKSRLGNPYLIHSSYNLVVENR